MIDNHLYFFWIFSHTLKYISCNIYILNFFPSSFSKFQEFFILINPNKFAPKKVRCYSCSTTTSKWIKYSRIWAC